MERRVWGYILTFISIVSLFIMYFQVRRTWYADFPCSYEYQLGRPVENSDSVISYCVTYIMRKVQSGGGIYSEGESSTNTVSIKGWYNPIDIERVDTEINVNGKLLEKGESTTWFEYYPTINPWVINNIRMTVTNQGHLDDSDAVYVEGEIREGWLLNPLGMILLALGIYLVRKKKVPT